MGSVRELYQFTSADGSFSLQDMPLTNQSISVGSSFVRTSPDQPSENQEIGALRGQQFDLFRLLQNRLPQFLQLLLRRRGFLVDVTRRAGAQQVYRVLIFPVSGENQHRQFRLDVR